MNRSSLSVLLLENNPDDRELIEHELRRVGFDTDVTEVTSAEAYGRALDESLPDVVLADFNIPSFSGYDSLRSLRDRTKHLPYIIVSGLVGEETAVDLLKAGATDIVTKNNLERLGPAIERAIDEYAVRQDRERAIADLEEQVHLVEEIQDAVPTPLFHKDPHGVYLGCNQAFSDLLGVSHREIVGSTVDDLVSEELARFVNDTDREVLETRAPRKHEYALRNSDGELRNFVFHKAPFYRADGALAGIIGVLFDVTDEKQYARELRHALDLRKSISESIDQVIIVVSAVDRRIRLANPAMRSVFGYDPDEVVGESTALLHVDDDHYFDFAETGDSVLEEQGVFRTEFPMRRRDGTVFPAEIAVSELSKAYGWRAGVVSVIKDISERKEAEEQLRAHQRELERVMENTPDVVLRLDRDLRIVYANPAVEAWSGIEPGEVLGSRLDEAMAITAFRDEGESSVAADIREVFRTGRRTSKQYSATIRERRLWVDSRIVPEFDSEGRLSTVLAIARDITERKKAEEALEEREEELRQAQRLESIGRLAGGVAHDFNNVLTAVGGYTYLALESVGSEEAVRSALNHVKEGVDRAARLTQQLLLFSRKAPSQMQRLDLGVVVESMFKMLGRLIGEHISVESDLAEEELPVRGDEGKIEQVVMNLVINARDAMPDGGRLTIATYRTDEYAVLSVRDTGTGMDKDTSDRIFEPFFTTKTKETGTGLGLSVVYGIVQEHGGWIDVDSQPGEGTAFHVYFPWAPDSDLEEAPGSPASGTATSGAGLVLLVEDEPDILSIAEAGLTNAGYRVVTARNLEEARTVWQQADHAVDAAIVDVVLPDGSGTELPALLEHAGDTAFVFVSGYMEDNEEFETIRREGYRFLQKPYGIPALLTVLSEELSESEEDT